MWGWIFGPSRIGLPSVGIIIWGNPMKKLTAFAIKAAMTRPGTYQDGDGLFLKVNKKGGAYWLLRLQRDGKRQDIGLGSAKLLPLAEARQKAYELRKAIKIDRRDVLAERKDEAVAKLTFREAARQYHTENAAGWKSAIYARQWLASLESTAFPKLRTERRRGGKGGLETCRMW